LVRNGVHTARSEEEKEAVYRFRYEIYVSEMGRYAGVADHENRRFREPEDDTARIFYAASDGEVVATSRMSWGGDAPFTERLTDHYRLEPFLAEIPKEAMAVGERGMVKAELRGSSIFTELGMKSSQFIRENRVQLIFGACEPHLLSRYVGQGSRTFASRNINSPDSGYLIPIVNVVEDIDYLRRIGSPMAETSHDWGEDTRIPECLERLLANEGNVLSQRLVDSGLYLGEVHDALDDLSENQVSALEGLTHEEVLGVLHKSNIIHCEAGDHVIKKGGTARNMFVILEGHLEVRDGDALLGVFGPGDIVGAMAFLLARPRVVDMYAATDCRILSLSEGTCSRRGPPDAEYREDPLLEAPADSLKVGAGVRSLLTRYTPFRAKPGQGVAPRPTVNPSYRGLPSIIRGKRAVDQIPNTSRNRC